MADELDRAIATLGDASKTWIARRDAADWLGKVAGRALDGLTTNRTKDGDRDVLDAVNRALAEARENLGGVPGKSGALTVESLVKSVERPGSRDVKQTDDGFEITMALPEGRSQKLNVTKGKSQADEESVHVSTRCGPAAEKAFRWALRTNAGFTRCGIALVEENGKEWFDLVNVIPLESVTIDEFKACIKEMAFYGDWAETKLSQVDIF
jgi:hypothetical protein